MHKVGRKNFHLVFFCFICFLFIFCLLRLSGIIILTMSQVSFCVLSFFVHFITYLHFFISHNSQFLKMLIYAFCIIGSKFLFLTSVLSNCHVWLSKQQEKNKTIFFCFQKHIFLLLSVQILIIS